MFVANELRKKQVPSNRVTWIIDRNANTTNVCNANCKFCNFFRIPGHKEAYITTIEEYTQFMNMKMNESNEGFVTEAGEVEKWDGGINKERAQKALEEGLEYLNSLKKD